MPTKTADELAEVTKTILLAAGANNANSERVAEALVASNLCGVETHGVVHLPRYMESIKAGWLLPAANPSVLEDKPTGALVTGNWTFGHVAAKFAMELAIEKARTHNVAVVGLVQSNHIGRLGEYVELAAASGMVGMVWAGGYGAEEPVAVPFGGRETALHTNPLSVGFPTGADAPVMFDFATTAWSGSKARLAHSRNETMPAGSIVDRDGNPTTDPNDLFGGGGHLAFGGHKGYALMVAVELLGRVFTGTDSYADDARGGPIMRRQGVTMIALKADLFQSLDNFRSRTDELADRLRAVPPAPGFDEVLSPGDPEARTRAKREHDGIPVAEDIWQSLVELANTLNVRIE